MPALHSRLRASTLQLILLPLLAAPALTAQTPTPAPTLQLSTHLVQFGVIARNKDGTAATLTRDDFVVLDRGKPQKLAVFQPELAPITPPAPLPPNTFSDEARYAGDPPRTITIVLLDNLNTFSGAGPEIDSETPLWLEDHALVRAKERLLGFLQQMNPGDRIAIYGLTDRLRILCDFTCSRDQLLAVVKAYDASSTTPRESAEAQNIHLDTRNEEMANDDFNQAIDADRRNLADMNNQRRAELTMAALTAIAGHVATLPGRKNLLWLTADLPTSGNAIADILSRGNLVAYPVDARGLIPRAPVTDLTNADPFQGGREIAFSLVPGAMPTGQAAMLDLAADTGGHAFLDTNNLTDAIRQVVENSAATYTLGFYVPQQELDGKFHRLTVKVSASGTSLTYPRGYFAFRDEGSTENERRNAFFSAIRSPLNSSAIPIDVRMARADQPAPSLQLVGVAGIGGVPFQQQGNLRTGALIIYSILQDVAGNVLEQVDQKLDLKLTEQQYESYLKSGIIFHSTIPLKPTATVARILVQDAGTAQIGCVIVPLARIQ